jgi:hypothetical protein
VLCFLLLLFFVVVILVFACLFAFVLCLVPILTLSLNCPFFIPPSVYLLYI